MLRRAKPAAGVQTDELGVNRAAQRGALTTVGAPHGYLDGVVSGDAMGWCWLREDPDTRLIVEVVIDGAPVASGTAELLRETVAEAGFGDGRYGFRIPLPAALADGGSHRIAIRAGGVELSASPTFARTSEVQDPDDPWSGTSFTPELVAEARVDRDADGRTDERSGGGQAPEPAPALRGYIDGIVGDAIVGWVVDEAQLDLAVELEAFLDGVFIGSAKADVARLDVARAGYGERHGFHFVLPTAVAPGDYVIEVRTTADRWRVPLVTDYSVYDAGRRRVSGVNLKEPRLSGQHLSREALLGLEGWMFEWPGPRVFEILTGRQAVPRPVFARQLERISERRDLTRRRGAALIETIVPSKLAIYPEHLPSGVALDDAARPATELTAALFEENGVDLVDLSLALRYGKRDGLIFSRTGRELTWLGGFVAYRVLAKELAKRVPELVPLPRSVVELSGIEPVADSLADLPRLVWIGSRTVSAGPGSHDEEREGRQRLNWTGLSAEYSVIAPELASITGPSAALLRNDVGRDASAIVIHDGSAAAIVPFLAEHFSRLLVTGTDVALDQLLEALRPEAVFEIVAERSLLLV